MAQKAEILIHLIIPQEIVQFPARQLPPQMRDLLKDTSIKKKRIRNRPSEIILNILLLIYIII